MSINVEDFKLPTDNYSLIECDKKQIVIGNTFNHDMRHVIGWLHRYNGKYKKTAPYTIAKDGSIYEHFNPIYQSKYFNDSNLDNKSIVILLENDGWLISDAEKNNFISWLGDIYNEPEKVFVKKWRGYSYWCPYTKEQMNSTIKLVNQLCEKFSIPKVSVNHNTKIDGLDNYEGIIYKSNLEKYYNDLNPSWDFEKFKEKIEKI
jgi:N-acetyl-anhydromuramyl-L-alanine amidase AmpD